MGELRTNIPYPADKIVAVKNEEAFSKKLGYYGVITDNKNSEGLARIIIYNNKDTRVAIRYLGEHEFERNHIPEYINVNSALGIKELHLYVDGSCIPNPGTGSYAFIVVRDNEPIYKHVTKVNDTTNNIMEISAALFGIRYLRNNVEDIKNYKITVFSDSEYMINSITDWCFTWKKYGWRKKDGREVANVEYFMALDTIREGLNVTFQWVRGHCGNRFNEMADELCSSVQDPEQYRKYTNFIKSVKNNRNLSYANNR